MKLVCQILAYCARIVDWRRRPREYARCSNDRYPELGNFDPKRLPKPMGHGQTVAWDSRFLMAEQKRIWASEGNEVAVNLLRIERLKPGPVHGVKLRLIHPDPSWRWRH